ncbi:MAG: hypothetical protein LBJ59_07235 [Zoogloeaceae bacterium]|nr:hypothetical protein [Zoogloeaceae bacterium]
MGNDTYQFGRGDGQDIINDHDTTTGNNDRVEFGAGITAEQFWFKKQGNDLEVILIGTEGKIDNWYVSASYRVE